jgi:hypothetical protein
MQIGGNLKPTFKLKMSESYSYHVHPMVVGQLLQLILFFTLFA